MSDERIPSMEEAIGGLAEPLVGPVRDSLEELKGTVETIAGAGDTLQSLKNDIETGNARGFMTTLLLEIKEWSLNTGDTQTPFLDMALAFVNGGQEYNYDDIVAGAEALPPGADPVARRLAPAIKDAGQHFKLPAKIAFPLLATFIHLESGGKEVTLRTTENKHGMKGIGQFSPSTWAQTMDEFAKDRVMVERFGLARINAPDKFHPTDGTGRHDQELMVFAMTHYIDKQTNFVARQLGKSRESVLADPRLAEYIYICYNFGPGRFMMIKKFFDTGDESVIPASQPHWVLPRAKTRYAQRANQQFHSRMQNDQLVS